MIMRIFIIFRPGHENQVLTPYTIQDRHPFRIRDLHRLDPDDILPRHVYAQCRREWVSRVSDYLRKRRVRLSANVSLLFENALTVWHQVQEVLYWETSNDKAGHSRIREELDIYRALLPTPSRLAATLFVDGGSRETGLAIGEALASGQSSIGLVIGDAVIRAGLADPDPDLAEPVKFLHFDLTRADRQTVLAGGPVSVWNVEAEKRLTHSLHAQTVSLLADDIKSGGRQALLFERTGSTGKDENSHRSSNW